MKYELLKKGRRTICYVAIGANHCEARTGKPSDAVCISWRYPLDKIDEARATAREFFENYTSH